MQYYENFFLMKHSDNIKNFWHEIKTVVTLKAKAKASLNSFPLNGHSITNKTSTAETFTDFLVNIDPNLVSNIPEPKKSFNYYLKNRVLYSIFLNPLKETEIVKLIGNLGSSRSLGLYGIYVKVLKNHVDSFKQPLTYFIKISFQQVFFLTL